MRRHTWGCFLGTLVVGVTVYAEPSVDGLRTAYEQERDRLVAEYAGQVEKAADDYVKSLEAFRSELKEQAKPDAAEAVTREIRRLRRERKILQDASETTLLVLKNIRNTSAPRPPSRLIKVTRSGQPPTTDKPKPETPSAAPLVRAGTTKIEHAAIGAKIEVSSTHTGEPGELPAESLVDGNLFTRWSSEYHAPQEVTITLDRPMKLSKLRLHWERAAATRYCVYVSVDGKTWTSVYLFMRDMRTSGEQVDRTDDIDLNGVLARQVRLQLKGAISREWGFSLYEVEILEAKPEPTEDDKASLVLLETPTIHASP